MAFARSGLVAGVGPAGRGDTAVIRTAGIDALKLRAHVNQACDLRRWRDAGVRTFLVQLLSPEPGRQPTSPQAFMNFFAPAIEDFVREGVRDFEVHGEPNLLSRGYGVSWHSPASFGDWFLEVRSRLIAAFGPQVRAGFPGLTPPPPRVCDEEPAVSQRAFLAACADAIDQGDFVCCHIYWDSAAGLRSVEGGMRFVYQYLEAFPTVPLVISEFANVSPNTDAAAKGAQYAEFYLAVQQYDACRPDYSAVQANWPRLQAAYALVLRSFDPVHRSLIWRDSSGQPSPIVPPVAQRLGMPSPKAMRFTWPTEVRTYTQFYGENQQTYYRTSVNHCLRGGHNGLDFRIRRDAPTSSPIRACLDGIVTSKRMLETGYGHHLYVESDVEGVGRVTLLYGHMTDVPVAEHDVVRAGQVLGTSGSTGASTGAHLHLSLKIHGLRFPANADHLNARPYLDPLPPILGEPRVSYERTYVLLPPDTDTSWPLAAVHACWDRWRYTVGGSADDAGIGALDLRRVVAVNPEEWDADLDAFFALYYPGVVYLPVEAESPEALADALAELPDMSTEPLPHPEPPWGEPRVPYERTYVLLPPGAGTPWADAAISGSWDRHPFTVGSNADDAGVGALDYRRVIAVNPGLWDYDLWRFFEQYYPGVLYVPLEARTPEELIERLRAF